MTGSVPPVPGLPGRLREVDLRLAPERAHAVDALEIAAYLEADGLSDEQLQGRYGAQGLFQAAELLYAQRGSGQALNRRVRRPAPSFPWRTLLRGPLYLLPGITGLLVTGVLGPGATAAFVFAAAFGWGHVMLLAALRYAEPLGVPGRALRAALVGGTLVGALGGALTAGGVAGPGQLALGALVGGVVALASGAAGVLLAFGRMGVFTVAFAAPLLAAGVALTQPSLPAALAALGLLAAMPTYAAWSITRVPGTLPVSWATLAPGLRLAAYGWALAAACVALGTRLGAGALLPLVLSAGGLEAGVWHAQERLQHAAREERDLGALRWRGRLAVILVAAGYALALALGVRLMGDPALGGPGLPPDLPTVIPASGAALLLSAWLANHGRAPLLLAVWTVTALLLTCTSLSPTLLLPLLALSLLALALSALQDPRSYR